MSDQQRFLTPKLRENEIIRDFRTWLEKASDIICEIYPVDPHHARDIATALSVDYPEIVSPTAPKKEIVVKLELLETTDPQIFEPEPTFEGFLAASKSLSETGWVDIGTVRRDFDRGGPDARRRKYYLLLKEAQNRVV